MANNNEFNKIIKRLNGRLMVCKSFYDYYNNKIDVDKNEVYIKKDVEDIIAQLKEIHNRLQDEFEIQKKKVNDFEIENYKLNKEKRKIDGNTNKNKKSK